MAGSLRLPSSFHSRDTSPIRLSVNAVALKKIPRRLPPIEAEARTPLRCRLSSPLPPPPTPAPWSWYHRDCAQGLRIPKHHRPVKTKEERILKATLKREEEEVSDVVAYKVGPTAPNSPISMTTSVELAGGYDSDCSCMGPIMVEWSDFASYPRLVPRRREIAAVEFLKVRVDTEMSEFLLQVAQAVFEEMVSLDQLIKRILEFAQRLVNADRASLFLVDYRNSELVSTVFDLKYEPNQDNDMSKKEIRMPINKGIAGHVAMFGETMNIPDAYSDQRFNKAVDEATGYRTSSILCMPIKVRGKVIAVVQMVNKRDRKVFDAEDEAAFQVFSTFFGLALHHAKLYDKIVRKEQKYKIALEVLSYHNTCAEEDVKALLEEKSKEVAIDFNNFMLNPFEVSDMKKCKGYLTMFDDLFDLSNFDVEVLARFVLTVKKNYRKVPYHNFDHGWAVANTMYVILKRDTKNRFDYKTRLGLFVASLCHDLDHRGYTNRYMCDISSPLAAMYSTSTLEHHHFNITVTILQQEGHNIFARMSGEEYKDILSLIRSCILATDLAVFFPNLSRIKELIFEKKSFDWREETHRSLSRNVLMTSADLSAATKPFLTQLKTSEIIQAEFYRQGDLEKQAGRTPIPMMDRDKPEELPASQVGFIAHICLPCYEVLCHLLPDTKPMYTMACNNLDIWRSKAAVVERSKKKKKCSNSANMDLREQ